MATAPTRRGGNKTVWTGTELLLLGGVIRPNDANASTPKVRDDGGEAYDPRLDQWRSIAPGAPLDLRGLQAVWTGREALLWGGRVAASGVAYDPQTDSWRQMNGAGAPSARIQFSSLWTGEELIVWGGSGKVGKQDVHLDTGGRYRKRAKGAPSSRVIKRGRCPRANECKCTANEPDSAMRFTQVSHDPRAVTLRPHHARRHLRLPAPCLLVASERAAG
ncbi:MAG: hypothetical protein RBU37_23970 [Myxococcota bacterium]|nr:hypothetical protein [Myxococcota bacterium]